MTTPVVRPLGPPDAAAFQALRLLGLREASSAFASSYEEEVDLPIAEVARRLGDPDGAVFGAWRDRALPSETLLGVVGIRREAKRKMTHRAFLWGMFVHPEARGSGVGRALVEAALDHAASRLRVRHVNLGVNAANLAAIRLYRSVGFTDIGTEPEFLLVDGVYHDELHMTCDLRPRGGGGLAQPDDPRRSDD